MSPKPMDYESINENVKKAQYAVRGELYLRASELEKEGKKVKCDLLFRIPGENYFVRLVLQTPPSFLPLPFLEG